MTSNSLYYGDNLDILRRYGQVAEDLKQQVELLRADYRVIADVLSGG